ncbi:MAG: monovalent cation/H(+) antiporter subunit G [Wolbachia endosymbiont of Meromenopon meropis]|nr:monovalent cation/H(+) antiporter subunit G [Wolbachia endosymbiont of Meromenopon meropis]
MIGSIFIFLGIFLVIISTIGIFRFPDFYTRLHAVSITDSGGAMLLLVGLALNNEFSVNTIKIVMLLLLIWIANSTNSYILAYTYYKSKRK